MSSSSEIPSSSPQTPHQHSPSSQPTSSNRGATPGPSNTNSTTPNPNPRGRNASRNNLPPDSPGAKAMNALQAIVDLIERTRNTLPKNTSKEAQAVLASVSSLATQAIGDIGHLVIWQWNNEKLSLKSEIDKLTNLITQTVGSAVKDAVLGPQDDGSSPGSLRELVQAANNAAPTYSQVLSRPPNKSPAVPVRPAAPKPLETVISLADVPTSHPIHEKSDFETRGLIQQAISTHADLAGLSVRNARARRNTKQISFTMQSNEATALVQKHTNEWLNELAPNAKHIPRKFPVVLNGTPTSIDLDTIHAQNQRICNKGDIESIKWLSKGGIEGKQHASLLVTFTLAEAADRAIHYGMYANKHCIAHKYMPSPPQCWNCQKFGHFSASCRTKGTQVCGRCAGPHDLKNCGCPKLDGHTCSDPRTCPQIKKKCANCG
ncbi:hypothetical protein BOTBODRAFT_148301, partial [Botryobasidium botryosum FD-172 SS1]